MSKYKVGDKFEVEISQVIETTTGGTIYAMDKIPHTFFDVYDLSQMERIEPEVDWSKVAVDTPILVKDLRDDDWERRYFAWYEEEEIYAWSGGATSWSVKNQAQARDWKYAKLAEVEE